MENQKAEGYCGTIEHKVPGAEVWNITRYCVDCKILESFFHIIKAIPDKDIYICSRCFHIHCEKKED